MKIPQPLLIKVAEYYIHRSLQKEKKWNKQEDLRAIDKLCVQYKIGFTAIAGTFLFTKGKQQVWIDEKSYPQGRKTL